MSAEKVEKAALELTQKQRAKLASILLRSIDKDECEEDPEVVAKAWDEEIARRVKALRSGETKAIPWEEAEARLRSTLARRRRK